QRPASGRVARGVRRAPRRLAGRGHVGGGAPRHRHPRLDGRAAGGALPDPGRRRALSRRHRDAVPTPPKARILASTSVWTAAITGFMSLTVAYSSGWAWNSRWRAVR